MYTADKVVSHVKSYINSYLMEESRWAGIMYGAIIFFLFGGYGLFVYLVCGFVFVPPKMLKIYFLILGDASICMLSVFFALEFELLWDDSFIWFAEGVFNYVLLLVTINSLFNLAVGAYDVSFVGVSNKLAAKTFLSFLVVSVALYMISYAYQKAVPLVYVLILSMVLVSGQWFLRFYCLERVVPFTKRVFDVVVSFVSLCLLLPVFLWVAYKVRQTGKQIIFGHVRVGRGGRKFKCLKFRSMSPNAQQWLQGYLDDNPEAKKEWEKDRKLKDDPRVTPFGRFIRRTSLDELPQLINVLLGQMSLVGPRPVPEEELNVMYGKAKKHYLKAKPGITGLWQISGRNDVDYEERISMDRWYASRASIFSDVIILLKTIMVVLRKQGSY